MSNKKKNHKKHAHKKPAQNQNVVKKTEKTTVATNQATVSKTEKIENDQKTINRLHTKVSLIFFAIIAVACLLLYMAGQSAAPDKLSPATDKTVVEQPVEKVEEDAISKSDDMAEVQREYPTYSIELKEKPVETMWEFTHAIKEQDAAVIGKVVSSFNDEKIDYEITIIKEPSLIADEHLYYIALQSQYMDEAFWMRVTEVTIDDVWNTLLLNIEDWNEMSQTEDFAPVEYNKFEALANHLKECTDEYMMKEIPAQYFIVHGEPITIVP